MEFLGSLLFLFVSVGTLVFSCNTSATLSAGGTATQTCSLTEPRVLVIAFGFGIGIFTMIYLVAPFSGGHLNPAVTVGLLVGCRITLLRAVLFIPAQLAGATVGTALVKAINKDVYALSGGGANSLSTGTGLGAGWTLETVLTFGLMIIVMAATDAGRGRVASHMPVLAPLAVGLWVFLANLVAIPIDGCSINPARTFGPAVVAENWAQHWLYWVGPLSGSILAAIFYAIVMEPIAVDIVDATAHPVKLPQFPGVGTMRERDWQSLKEEIANADEEDEEVVLDDSAKSSPAIRRSLRSMESAQP
ncbi:hypothetical protein WJX84_007372 [Apatococcus fuscideae]|uniref:Aquaporin n=1 Tax=Apatococcus fuscideae TaxID=2026836 RepID=A0AAW1SDI9_9CHLO